MVTYGALVLVVCVTSLVAYVAGWRSGSLSEARVWRRRAERGTWSEP